MYRVIKHFTDLQDNRHAYNPGDEFPREGLRVTKKRLEELASDQNRRKEPLIELVEEAEEPLTETEATESDEQPEQKEQRKRKNKEE